VYFLYPRIPQVQVGNYRSTSASPRQTGSGASWQLQLDGAIDINVTSVNVYPIAVAKVSVDIFPQGLSGQTNEKIGYGELNNFVIEKQALTQLTFPINMFFGPPQSRSTYIGFLGSCQAGAAAEYVVSIYLNVLTAFKQVPTTKGTIVITCPAGTSSAGAP